MTPLYALDTNAYALLFQHPKSAAYQRLEELIKTGDQISFYLPEVVAMEIHSVIGKYRRGGSEQRDQCSKNIITDAIISTCANTCYTPKRTRLKAKVFKGLQKLMSDIENRNGDIKADLLPLGKNELLQGRRLLAQHAHQFSFGSHDALIAGTVLVAAAAGNVLTLVTSDKSLKAVCREQGIPIFDPLLEPATAASTGESDQAEKNTA